MSEIKQILTGHTSRETAYEVKDYPYGFTLRTSIFYWIESTKNGDRFCSCTINPKDGTENKPKKSTYSPFLYMYLNEINHVTFSALTSYKVDEFRTKLPEIIKLVGIENISEAQQKSIRFDHYGNLRAGYGWILPKYSDERKPLYTAWMKATLTHIAKAPFAEIVNYESAPEQDQPEESVKFTVTGA